MSNMTDSETYNGYANRETWAFNLHWQNDQSMYNMTLEAAGGHLACEGDRGDLELGEYVVKYWREFIDESRDEIDPLAPVLAFEREVGSWWRIDYREVGEAVRESLDAES